MDLIWQAPTRDSDAPWWGEYLAQYREAIRYIRGARLLDLGCRTGYGSRYLFDHGANEVVGIDLNGADIVIAQQNFGRDGVSFVAGDAKTLPFPPKSFDAVTCFQVLESTVSADHILHQIRRVLVPGGVALLTTVNRKRTATLREAPLEAEHVQEFDHDELKHLLKKNFTSIEIHGLVCTRNGQRGGPLDFMKGQIENRIPWKLKKAVSKKIFGVSYYPDETEFVLRGTAVGEAPLFFAVCRS